jgi:hypothetical protein
MGTRFLAKGHDPTNALRQRPARDAPGVDEVPLDIILYEDGGLDWTCDAMFFSKCLILETKRALDHCLQISAARVVSRGDLARVTPG